MPVVTIVDPELSTIVVQGEPSKIAQAYAKEEIHPDRFVRYWRDSMLIGAGSLNEWFQKRLGFSVDLD
jgi:hypothetical protein